MERRKEIEINFVLNEPLNEVLAYVEKHKLSEATQKELMENYPETFIMIAEKASICTSIMIKMIESKNAYWLPTIMKKDFFFDEEIEFVKTYPEKVKEYLEMEGEQYLGRCLTPEGEDCFHSLWVENNDIPNIRYIWHPEWN